MPTAAGPPETWDSAAARRWPAAVLMSITVALLAGAGWAAGAGERTAAVVLAAGAVYVGHLAGLAVSARWTPRRSHRQAPGTHTGRDRTGIRYAYSLWPYYWLCSVLVLTAVGLAAVAVLAATAGPSGVAVAVVTGMLAAVVAWFLGTVLRLAPGEVRVSAEGVLHRSLTATHFVPWYAVFDVTAEFAGTPLIVVKAHTSDGTRLRRHTGRLGTAEMQFLPYLVVRVPWLAADPVEVYRTLTFYAAHADRRSDLATGAQPGFATDVGREA